MNVFTILPLTQQATIVMNTWCFDFHSSIVFHTLHSFAIFRVRHHLYQYSPTLLVEVLFQCRWQAAKDLTDWLFGWRTVTSQIQKKVLQGLATFWGFRVQKSIPASIWTISSNPIDVEKDYGMAIEYTLLIEWNITFPSLQYTQVACKLHLSSWPVPFPELVDVPPVFWSHCSAAGIFPSSPI